MKWRFFSGALFSFAAGCARFGYESLPLKINANETTSRSVGPAGADYEAGIGGRDAGNDPRKDGTTGGMGVGVDASGNVSNGADAGTGPGSVAAPCEAVAAPADWWDPSFGYRRRLVFNNSGQSQALDDFVVLVVLRASGATPFDYNHARADGADLRFVDDDGVTQLAHHVERWQPGGVSYLWVRGNRIDAASASDHIWLYHGNPTAPAIDDETGTYATDFGAVFHLGETSGSFRDSVSGTDCNWNPQAESARGAAGAIGAAVTVANDAGIVCPNDMLLGMGDYTITAWVQPKAPGSSTAYATIIAAEGLSSPFAGPSLILRSSDPAVAAWYESSYVSSSAKVTEGTWSMATLRVKVDSLSGVIEGRVNAGPWDTLRSGDTTGESVVPGTPLTIGTWIGGGLPAYFQGDIDEVRVSRVVRSDDYLAVEYLSQTDALITQSSETAAFCVNPR